MQNVNAIKMAQNLVIMQLEHAHANWAWKEKDAIDAKLTISTLATSKDVHIVIAGKISFKNYDHSICREQVGCVNVW